MFLLILYFYITGSKAQQFKIIIMLMSQKLSSIQLQ